MFNEASGLILSVFSVLSVSQRCRVRRVSGSVVDGLVLFLFLVIIMSVGLAAVFSVLALCEVLVVLVALLFFCVLALVVLVTFPAFGALGLVVLAALLFFGLLGLVVLVALSASRTPGLEVLVALSLSCLFRS